MGLSFQPVSASGESICFCKSRLFLIRKAICPGFTSELMAASVASISLTGQSLLIGLQGITDSGTGSTPAGAGGLGGSCFLLAIKGRLDLRGIMAISPWFGVVGVVYRGHKCQKPMPLCCGMGS